MAGVRGGGGAAAGRPRVLMVTPRTFPQSPVVKRNVEYLLESGAEVDLVHIAPTAAAAWRPDPHPRLRRFQVPVRHRRSPAAWYLVEYSAFFVLSLAIASWLGLRHRYAAVHVDNLPDNLVFAAFVPRLRGSRVLLNIVDPMPELAASRLGIGRRHPVVALARLIERASAAWADRVTVPNEEPCRRLVVARGTPAAKVAVLANTLPVADRAPRPPAPPLTVVCLGTLLPRYGVDVAIAAVAELRRRRPDLVLEVIGSGEAEPELRRVAAALEVEDAVRFRGFLPWSKAMARVRRAAVGVVPLVADGFGELMTPTKLFDYVQQGIPAVCARLPGIMGFFPADSVRYFEPGDPLDLAVQVEALLADPDGATAMARRAQAALAAFRWERSGPRYLELLGLPVDVRAAAPVPREVAP